MATKRQNRAIRRNQKEPRQQGSVRWLAQDVPPDDQSGRSNDRRSLQESEIAPQRMRIGTNTN
ncbi:Uncharacterized protein ChrSV_0635 [Chromobacterium vaccinii]|nr:Uncharacterized protein ChrSW_0635 [Chromobacterium vaccinii]QND88094.1 Uncharacterized protein ChrSV_0635 [Chromobacterium vaccinii]